jgi:lipopolysaccharide biosynthesis glycosyltransferase
MDRLLLPELLPELDRIVYHDLDALPLGDLAELSGWDLAGHPIAARSAIATHVLSGFSNIVRSAKRLRGDHAAAYDLLRRMYTRHNYDFTSFNAGILVLDLDRMRAEDFCRDFVPFVERYGMNDQEVLNCYAGPRRAVLPSRWNAIPTQEPVIDPLVIHWAGPLKPWKDNYVVLREVWAEYAQRVAQR